MSSINYQSPELIDNSISNGNDSSIFVIQESLDTNNANKRIKTEANLKNFYQIQDELKRLEEENLNLKNERDYLKGRYDKCRCTEREDDSLMAYIDVDKIRISNRIELYLIETNKIFKDKTQMRNSMEYLIKSIWSLVAHEYADTNLEILQMAKTQLLDKLKSIEDDNYNLETMVRSQVKLADETDQSLNAQIELFRSETFNLRDKVKNQNEIIKNVIKQLDLKKKSKENNCTQTESESNTNLDITHAISNKNENFYLNSNEEERYNDFSPSVSPNSFLLDQFKETLEKYSIRSTKRVEEDTNGLKDDLVDSEQDESYSSAKEEHPKPTGSKLRQIYNSMSIYNILNYVSFGKKSEKPINKDDKSVMEDSSDSSETLLDNVKENRIQKCPVCSVSIDSYLIPLEKIEEHKRVCNDSRLVCMFCLVMFDLDQRNKFEDHIEKHMNDQEQSIFVI